MPEHGGTKGAPRPWTQAHATVARGPITATKIVIKSLHAYRARHAAPTPDREIYRG